ncbi:shikimate kinase [Alkalibaculum bacchi]|uniref:Shikimate kinase n=1 Tax=Alkalibaculum bacchi TaxID=645887 RepID=A0A366I6L7_9FIRM|nr:shikimate kinase [Alkalibaculum bacchi]RBP64413.1 shikimate kinase [Alkalibaculum bacchi]
MNKNIVLIGMPGCGKSTLSKIMAKRLNKPVIDMDDYIESHEEKTIKEMFDISEAFFRDVESKYSILLGELNSHIIATGGGIVKRKENITNLKKNSVIVFINRPVDDIVGDIDVRTRPLLSKGVEAVYSLYNERIHLYKGYCDIEINNVGEIQKVADLIIEKVQLYKVENNQ